MAVARCVLPVPDEPTDMIFSLFSMNRSDIKSSVSFLFMIGWKLKSKSSIVFLQGNYDVCTQALIAYCSFKFISFSVRSYNASIVVFEPRNASFMIMYTFADRDRVRYNMAESLGSIMVSTTKAYDCKWNKGKVVGRNL